MNITFMTIFQQTPLRVEKQGDENEEESFESVPHLPNTLCKFLNFLNVFF